MTDILLDNDGNLQFENGDIVIGESTAQHQKHLLLADKGTIKQYPTVGVGVFGFLKAEDPDELMRRIRLELTQDGQKVSSLSLDSGVIKIEAEYNGDV